MVTILGMMISVPLHSGLKAPGGGWVGVGWVVDKTKIMLTQLQTEVGLEVWAELGNKEIYIESCVSVNVNAGSWLCSECHKTFAC